MISGVEGHNGNLVDVDYSPTELISPVDNWHIVLVQETGVVTGTHPCPEAALTATLSHHISFNSPPQERLHKKQYQEKVQSLTALLSSGAIDNLQFHTKCEAAKGAQDFPSGGLAIMVHHCVSHFTQINQTFCCDPLGGLVLCHRTMALSASVNGKLTCFLNVYTPADGYQVVSNWINLVLAPMLYEVRQHGWDIVAGGDYNTTPTPLDQGNPRRHQICPGLSSLLTTASGLTNAYHHLHPTWPEFSWHRLTKNMSSSQSSPLTSLPLTCLNQLLCFLPPVDAHHFLSLC